MDAVATPASYTTRIERDGVEVFVSIGVPRSYPDVDELAEIAALAATRTSTSVHESVARSELREPF